MRVTVGADEGRSDGTTDGNVVAGDCVGDIVGGDNVELIPVKSNPVPPPTPTTPSLDDDEVPEEDDEDVTSFSFEDRFMTIGTVIPAIINTIKMRQTEHKTLRLCLGFSKNGVVFFVLEVEQHKNWLYPLLS